MTGVLPEIAAIRRVMNDAPPDAANEAAFRVAVVTPYRGESEALLTAAHESVRAQTFPCTHILIADGSPAPFVSGWDAQHIALPVHHGDVGDTPRAVGAISAVGQGFDAITFLDADNWYAPDHIDTMVALHRRTGAQVCVAARALHRLDGSLLRPRGEYTDGIEHVDTNCLFLTSAAYRVVPLWGLIPKHLHLLGDRLIWSAVRALGYRVARWTKPTVAYRTAFRVHYEEEGETPPPGAKDNAAIVEALRWWHELPEPDRALVFRRLGLNL
ncbi:MAG: glycosyltransferase [Minicystis sp.]